MGREAMTGEKSLEGPTVRVGALLIIERVLTPTVDNAEAALHQEL